MAQNSNIEWTDATWNPIIGCSKCSPGCENCYAERMAHRLRHMGVSGYTSAIELGGWTGKTALVPERLEEPLHWRKPRRVFVCSMSDLFHESVPDEWITRVFHAMSMTPRHTYMLLTKRPERMRHFIARYSRDNAWGAGYSHVWLGVTVCTQAEADAKIPLLLQIPAAVRWVSIEPMLGPVDLHYTCFNGADSFGKMPGLDWVVLGGETGPGARPLHPAWARGVRDQCQAAGVPFFFKKDSAGSRLLDGRTWDEMPAAR